jgi:hypothetical protein
MAKIEGNNSGNSLPGTNGRDHIFGRDGDDELSGLDGNDFLFGGRGNDTIFGGAGKDTLKGGNDNDTLDGGAGNDKIDGGKGIDTAVYHGNYDDFDITPTHKNNDKFTVAGTTPATLAANGIDTLDNVEFLKFDDAVVNLQSGDVWHYAANVAPDPSAQDPASPGNLYVGSGIPATGFGVARNEDAGIELGFQVIYRQGPVVTTSDDYADGVLQFQVNDGPQSTANGSFANNPNRAAWNFQFSVATGLNGETTDLDNFTFKLLIDTDKGAGTNYVSLTLEPELTPQAAGQSGYQWRDDASGIVLIADDEGTGNVTQNSQNYAFYNIPGYNIGNAFAGPGTFDLQLLAFDDQNNLIGQNHIQVDVLV